jgi:hypothetical protein
MRLETQLAIIDEARKTIKPLMNPTHRGNQIYKAPGKVKYRETLLQLSSISYLKSEVDSILGSDAMGGGGDEFTFLESEMPAFQGRLQQMAGILEALSKALGNVVAPSSDDVLVIRLPALTSLNDLEAFTHRIQTILSAIVLVPGRATNDTRLEFLGVETGANWFRVSVGTAVAVSLVRLVCAMVQDIAHTEKTFQDQAALAKELGAESALADDAKKVGDQIVDRLVAKTAKDLNGEYYAKDPEQEVRLAHALSELLQAVKQGTTMERARGLPEETSEDDTVEKLKAVLQPQKQLTEAGQLTKLPTK